jgi:hypothetical protein
VRGFVGSNSSYREFGQVSPFTERKFLVPGVLDDGIPEVSSAGLDDLETDVLYGAVVETDVVECQVVEGAVLEKAVYPAHVLN